jgi:sugar O-acyltransferase (sialic acid O-acetyltransferase NeuD family)
VSGSNTQCSVVIAGAGGLGREFSRWWRQAAEVNWPQRFIDDRDESISDFSQESSEIVFVAIGKSKDRYDVAARLTNNGVRISSWAHPTVIVDEKVVLETKNYLMMPYSLVSCGCKIGHGLFLNTYASIGHDCVIGHYVTIHGHAAICGNVTIGNMVEIGASAVITPGVEIGEGAFIAAGSVVTRDVPPHTSWMGNPAKRYL